MRSLQLAVSSVTVLANKVGGSPASHDSSGPAKQTYINAAMNGTGYHTRLVILAGRESEVAEADQAALGNLTGAGGFALIHLEGGLTPAEWAEKSAHYAEVLRPSHDGFLDAASAAARQ